MMMEQLKPIHYEGSSEYELLDSGELRKLEKIAGILVDRPCPQAIWKKRLPKKEWDKAQSVCLRTKDGGGQWKHPKEFGKEGPSNLSFHFDHKSFPQVNLRLKFTSFGHCGVFFEQVPLWQKLQLAIKHLQELGEKDIKVINLFGYTGGASLSMAQARAQVFHVDSAKGVLNWGKESEKLTRLPEGQVRWVHQDVRDFLTHSKKKGFKYHGIFLDPPSWGHGTKKEVFEYNLEVQKLIGDCLDLLTENNHFILLTSHTPGVQAHALVNLFPNSHLKKCTFGDLGVQHKNDPRILPAGIYYWHDNMNSFSF